MLSKKWETIELLNNYINIFLHFRIKSRLKKKSILTIFIFLLKTIQMNQKANYFLISHSVNYYVSNIKQLILGNF